MKHTLAVLGVSFALAAGLTAAPKAWAFLRTIPAAACNGTTCPLGYDDSINPNNLRSVEVDGSLQIGGCGLGPLSATMKTQVCNQSWQTGSVACGAQASKTATTASMNVALFPSISAISGVSQGDFAYVATTFSAAGTSCGLPGSGSLYGVYVVAY